MMPDDRDRARKAKKQFFARPAAEHQETSDSRDVP
jgi:hypothetical protein